MKFPSVNPTSTPTWKQLEDYYQTIKSKHLKEWFSEDSSRANNMCVEWNDFYFDFSKNRIDKTGIDLLLELANNCGLKQAIASLKSGEKINATEHREVLHFALRASKEKEIYVNGKDVVPEIHSVLKQMQTFSNELISGNWKGYTGKQITDVVNIGIGGSDLGPVMVCEALKAYKNHLNVHFVSNVDPNHISEVLKKVNPDTTLFLIASKTFTTQETIANANAAKIWFLHNALNNEFVKLHFVAISTNATEVSKFGIDTNNMFPFWDWVGGRYSLWSAIGLSICLSVGFENFSNLLKGAEEMDEHFFETPFDKNIPTLAALLGIWYNNFFNSPAHAVLPYDQYLHRFTAYLQQADMESNGKSVDRNGEKINYQTGPIIWGEPGTNGQHAFYQLLHQGTKLIPADFIAFANSLNPIANQHQLLLSNFFAQTEALMNGKTKTEVVNEFINVGKKESEYADLINYKIFEGNNPTNSLLIKNLTPKNLGSLIAMYEHRIFVQGVIWNVFSFDQWGVELGKQLANKIIPELMNEKLIDSHDSSTNNLINTFKKYKN